MFQIWMIRTTSYQHVWLIILLTTSKHILQTLLNGFNYTGILWLALPLCFMEWMFAGRLERDVLRRGGGGLSAVNNQGAGGQCEWRQAFPSHNTLPLIHPRCQWTIHFSSHASLILSIRSLLTSTCNSFTFVLPEVKVYQGHCTLVFV